MAEPVTTEELERMVDEVDASMKLPSSHPNVGFYRQIYVTDLWIALAREALANRKAGEWRPIAEAPIDGTHIKALVESELTWEKPAPGLLRDGWRRVGECDKVIGWKLLPLTDAGV